MANHGQVTGVAPRLGLGGQCTNLAYWENHPTGFSRMR